MRVWVLAALLATMPTAPPTSPVVVATGVADEATEANSQPKLARDQRGVIYVTFVKPVGGTRQVFLASSADHGHHWRVEAVSRSPMESRYPTLAVGPDGKVHVAWTQYEGGVGGVFYAQFDGRRWTDAVRVSPGRDYAGIPALAIGPEGHVHMVWYGIRPGATTVPTRHGSLYEIIYTSAMRGQWSAPIVISPGVPDSINPTLGIDSQGHLHSAWYQFDLRSYQVRHAMRDQTWAQPDQISRGEDASSVAMAIDGTNTVYLVWERHEGEGRRIYFAERMRQWSEQQPLSAAGQAATDPTIAADDHGGLYVAWASTGTINLARRVGQWRGVDRIQLEGASDHPILSSNGSDVDLLWTQQIGGDRRLMFVSLATKNTVPSGPSPFWGIVFTIGIVAFLLLALWQRRKHHAASPHG